MSSSILYNILGFCGFESHGSSYSIPFDNVLWAEPKDPQSSILTISYVKKVSSTKVKPETIDVLFSSNLAAAVILSQPRANQNMTEVISKFSKESMSTQYTDTTVTAGANTCHPGSVNTKIEPPLVHSQLKTQETVSTSTACVTVLTDPETVRSLAESIIDCAYTVQNIVPRKRFLVLINPHSGRGNAKKTFELQCRPILEAARCSLTVIETTHKGHAEEISRSTDDLCSMYDAIICCSGDGIPHELINGFAQRKQGDAAQCLASLPICQLPCGSGNSMSISLNGTSSPSIASLYMVKGVHMPVDLMLMSQGATAKPTLSFLSQALGAIADADLGTESLRWMGPARFLLGTLSNTLQGKSYPCDIHVKFAHQTKQQVKDHYYDHHEKAPSLDHALRSDKDLLEPLFGSVADPVPDDWVQLPDGDHVAVFYAGKMPWISEDALMFPATLPTDGTIDIFMSHTNHIGPLVSVKMLLNIETGTHINHSKTLYSKALAYRLVPKKSKGYLAVDGEFFPHEPFQVEVLPRAGCLLSPTGVYAHTGY